MKRLIPKNFSSKKASGEKRISVVKMEEGGKISLINKDIIKSVYKTKAVFVFIELF